MKTDLLHFGVVLLLALCTTHAQVRSPAIPSPPPAADVPSEFLDIRPDGGYRFGYNTGDFGQHQHAAEGTPDGRVAGRYSERGRQTIYTAGPRGFRARGTHIARRMDLSQNRIPYNPPVSPDSPAYNPTYSGYHDPNEDPSYSFGFRTPTYNRQENSNSNAEVTGQYSYIDDVGERHQVDYIAGARTGFHVKTPYPDSIPLTGSLFVRAPGKPGQKARGRTAIQRGLDGSYRFTAAGPDQRRVEVSDSTGHVRGSYTYLDDKGVQRTTEYIAGPNIGYKVINSKKGPIYPYLPSGFPSPLPPGKDILNRPVDDLFDLPEGLNTAESGAAFKPPKKGKPSSDESLEDISSSSESGSGSQISPGKKPSKDSTSSASGGDNDFLLSLDDSAGSYGKPTSDYGTSDSSLSSGSPGNLLGSTGNGHAGGGHTFAQDKDGQIFGKPTGFNNIQQVSGDGALNTNSNDDIFGLSPVFTGSGDNTNGLPLGGGLVKPTTGSSLFGGPEKPVGSSLTQLDSDIFGSPDRPSSFLSQTNDTNVLRPSGSDKFGHIQQGQGDTFDLGKPNSDDLFGSLSLDSGTFGGEQVGQSKPFDSLNKPHVDDLFGIYPGTSGEFIEHQTAQGKPIGDLTNKNHDDVFGSPGGSTFGNGAGTLGKPFNGITRPVGDDVFGLTPVSSEILGSHQVGLGKPSSSLTKPDTEDLFGQNPPGNIIFGSYEGTQVKPSDDYNTDNLFGPPTLSDGTKGHEQTHKPRPVDNLHSPSSDDLFGSFSPNNVLLASQQGIQGNPPPSDYIAQNIDDLFGSYYPGNSVAQPATQGKPVDEFTNPSTDDVFGSYSPGNGALLQGIQEKPTDDFTKPNTDNVFGLHSPGNGVIQQGTQGKPFGGITKPNTDDLFQSYSPGNGVLQQGTLGKPLSDISEPNTDELFGLYSPGNDIVQHGTQGKPTDDLTKPNADDLFGPYSPGTGNQEKPIGDFTKPNTDDLFQSYSPGNGVAQQGFPGEPVDDFTKPNTDDLFGSYSPANGIVQQGNPGKPAKELTNLNTDELFDSFSPGNGIVQQGTLAKPLNDLTKPNTDDLFGSFSPGNGVIQQGTRGKPVNDLTKPNTDDLFGSFSPGNGGVPHGTQGKPVDDLTKPNTDDLFGSFSPGNGVIQQGTRGKPVDDLTNPNTDDLFGSFSPGNGVIQQGTRGKPVDDLTNPNTDDLFGSFSPGNGVVQQGTQGKPINDLTKPNTDDLFGSFSPGNGVVQQGTQGKPVDDFTKPNADDLFGSYSPGNGVNQHSTEGKPVDDFTKPNADDLFGSYSPRKGVVQQGTLGKPVDDLINPNTDDLFGSYSPANGIVQQGSPGKPVVDLTKPNADDLYGSYSPGSGVFQQRTPGKPTDDLTKPNADDLFGSYSPANGVIQQSTLVKPVNDLTKPNADDLFGSFSPGNGVIQQSTLVKPVNDLTKPNADDLFGSLSPGNGVIQHSTVGKPVNDFTKSSADDLFGSYSPGNGVVHGKPINDFTKPNTDDLFESHSPVNGVLQQSTQGKPIDDSSKPYAEDLFESYSPGNGVIQQGNQEKPFDDFPKLTDDLFVNSLGNGALQKATEGKQPVEFTKPSPEDVFASYSPDNSALLQGTQGKPLDDFTKLSTDDRFDTPSGKGKLQKGTQGKLSVEFSKPGPEDLFGSSPGTSALQQGTEGKPQGDFIQAAVSDLFGPTSGKGAFQQNSSPDDHIKTDPGYVFQLKSAGKATFGNNLAILRKPLDDLTEAHPKESSGVSRTSNMFGSHLSVYEEEAIRTPKPNSSGLSELRLNDKKLPYDSIFSNRPGVFEKLRGIVSNDSLENPDGSVPLSEYGSSNYSISDSDLFTTYPTRFDELNEEANEKFSSSDSLGRPKLKIGNEFAKDTFRESFEEPQHIDKGIIRGNNAFEHNWNLEESVYRVRPGSDYFGTSPLHGSKTSGSYKPLDSDLFSDPVSPEVIYDNRTDVELLATAVSFGKSHEGYRNFSGSDLFSSYEENFGQIYKERTKTVNGISLPITPQNSPNSTGNIGDISSGIVLNTPGQTVPDNSKSISTHSADDNRVSQSNTSGDPEKSIDSTLHVIGTHNNVKSGTLLGSSPSNNLDNLPVGHNLLDSIPDRVPGSGHSVAHAPASVDTPSTKYEDRLKTDALSQKQFENDDSAPYKNSVGSQSVNVRMNDDKSSSVDDQSSNIHTFDSSVENSKSPPAGVNPIGFPDNYLSGKPQDNFGLPSVVLLNKSTLKDNYRNLGPGPDSVSLVKASEISSNPQREYFGSAKRSDEFGISGDSLNKPDQSQSQLPRVYLLKTPTAIALESVHDMKFPHSHTSEQTSDKWHSRVVIERPTDFNYSKAYDEIFFNRDHSYEKPGLISLPVVSEVEPAEDYGRPPDENSHELKLHAPRESLEYSEPTGYEKIRTSEEICNKGRDKSWRTIVSSKVYSNLPKSLYHEEFNTSFRKPDQHFPVVPLKDEPNLSNNDQRISDGLLNADGKHIYLEKNHYPPVTSDGNHKTSGDILKVLKGHSAEILPKYPANGVHGVSSESSILKSPPEQNLYNRKPEDYGTRSNIDNSGQNKDNINSNPLHRDAIKTLSEPEYRYPIKNRDSYILENKDQNIPIDVNYHHQNQTDMYNRYSTNQQINDYIGNPPLNLEQPTNGGKEPIVAVLNLEKTPRVFFVEPVRRDDTEPTLEDTQTQYKLVNKPLPSIRIETPTSKWYSITVGDGRLNLSLENVEKTIEDGSSSVSPGRDSAKNYNTKTMDTELPTFGNDKLLVFSSDRLSPGPGLVKSVNGHGRPPERDLFESARIAPDEPTNTKGKSSEPALLRIPTNVFVEGGNTVGKTNNTEFSGHQDVFENVGYTQDKGSHTNPFPRQLEHLERPRDGYNRLLNSDVHTTETISNSGGENRREPSQNNSKEHLANIRENYSTSTDEAFYENLNQTTSNSRLSQNKNSDSYTPQSIYLDSPNGISLERYPDMLRRQTLTNSSLNENRLSMSQKQGSTIFSQPISRELLETLQGVVVNSELDNSKSPTRDINESPQRKIKIPVGVYINNSDGELLRNKPQETEKLEGKYDTPESYERSSEMSENSGGGHKDSPNRKVLAYPTPHVTERPGTDFNRNPFFRSTSNVLGSPGRVLNTLPEGGVLMRSTENTKFRDNEHVQFDDGELFERPISEKRISEGIYSKNRLHYFEYKPENLETREISHNKPTYSDILGRPTVVLGKPENINSKLAESDLLLRPVEFSQKSGNDDSKVPNIDIFGSSPEISRRSESNYIKPVEHFNQAEVLEPGTTHTKDFKSVPEDNPPKENGTTVTDFRKTPDRDGDLVDVSRSPAKIKSTSRSDELLLDGAEDFKIPERHYQRPEIYLLERHPESISRPVLNHNTDFIDRTEELISKSGIGYNRTSDSDLFKNSYRDSGGLAFTHNRYSSPDLFQSSEQILGKHGINLSKPLKVMNRSDSVDSELFGITMDVKIAGTGYSKNSDSDLFVPYSERLDRPDGEYNRTSDVDLFVKQKNGYKNFSNSDVFESPLSVSESIYTKHDGIVKEDVSSRGAYRNELSDTDIFGSHPDVSQRPEGNYRKQPEGSLLKNLPETMKRPADYYKDPSDGELLRRVPDVSERLEGDYNSTTDRALFGVFPEGERNLEEFYKKDFNSDIFESHPEVSKSPGRDFKRYESDLFGDLSEKTQRLMDSRPGQFDSELVRRMSKDSGWLQDYYNEPFVRDFYGIPKEIYGRPGIGSRKFSHSNSFGLHPQHLKESVDDYRRHSSGDSYGNLPDVIQKPFNSELFRSPLKVLGRPVNVDHKNSFEELFVRQPDIFERRRLNYNDFSDKMLRRPYEDIEISRTMYKGVSGRHEKDYLFSRPIGHLGRPLGDYNTNDVFGSHPDVSRRSESDHIRSSDSDLYRDSLRVSERPLSGYLKFSDSDLSHHYKGSLRNPESDYSKPYERGSFRNSREFFERSERGNVKPSDVELFDNPEVF